MLPEQNNLLHDLTFDNVSQVAEQVMKSFTSRNLTGLNWFITSLKMLLFRILQMKYFFRLKQLLRRKSQMQFLLIIFMNQIRKILLKNLYQNP